ncbi:MAG: transposase [Synergistaceae bacterium]|nr:transposase [Synergistaceae bacterium]
MIWILITGAPWRDLLPEYGDWKNTDRSFYRWRDKGIWEMLFNLFVQDPDFEWLMTDTSYIKVHPHAAGAM